jgi:succinate dehydrogenase hydrophobic anchor subunit
MTERPSPPEAERPWSWHLLRASSWVLLVVFPLWFLSVHVIGDVATVNATTLERRWSSPAGRVLDWVVVVLGLVHGAAGLSSVLRSRRSGGSPSGIDLGVGALYGLTTLLCLAVTAVVFTYEIT